MTIRQKLNDAKKESAENEKAIEHYSIEHDKLKLEEVEYVTSFIRTLLSVLIFASDDDEEEEEVARVKQADVDENADVNEQAIDEPSKEPGGQDEETVKPEPTDDATPKSKKKRSGASSTDLHVYTAEELSQFKKKGLLADVALLDGLSYYSS